MTVAVQENTQSTSSTQSYGIPPIQQYASGTGSSPIGETAFAGAVMERYAKIPDMVKEIENLQKEVREAKDISDEIKKLSKTSRIAIILLLIVPIIQVAICAAVIYCLSVQENLNGLLNLFLGGISVASFIELLIGGVKIYTFDERIKSLENKSH